MGLVPVGLVFHHIGRCISKVSIQPSFEVGKKISAMTPISDAPVSASNRLISRDRIVQGRSSLLRLDEMLHGKPEGLLGRDTKSGWAAICSSGPGLTTGREALGAVGIA